MACTVKSRLVQTQTNVSSARFRSLELSIPRPAFNDEPGKTRMLGLRYHDDSQDDVEGVETHRLVWPTNRVETETNRRQVWGKGHEAL